MIVLTGRSDPSSATRVKAVRDRLARAFSVEVRVEPMEEETLAEPGGSHWLAAESRAATMERKSSTRHSQPPILRNRCTVA